MLKHDGVEELIPVFRKEREKSSLARHLAELRKKKGFTQAQFAEKIGCAQSRISNFECTDNRDISLGMLAQYSEILNERITLQIGKPMNHVESVKHHFLAMAEHLRALSDLVGASKEKDCIQDGIRRFQDEAVVNLLDLAMRIAPPKKGRAAPASEDVSVFEFSSESAPSLCVGKV